MKILFWSLGIFPRPSMLKPLLFLGSCFFSSPTRGCLGCEKNVKCEPSLSNFITNRCYPPFYFKGTYTRQRRPKGKATRGRPTVILKRILEIKQTNSLIFQMGKLGLGEVLVFSNHVARLAASQKRPQSHISCQRQLLFFFFHKELSSWYHDMGQEYVI